MTRVSTAVVHWWRKNNFPDGGSSVLDGALVLSEEVGEVARAVLKRHQKIRGSYEEWSVQIQKELADVIIAAHAIAGVEGFDLDDAVKQRWETISQRNFITDQIGHGIGESVE
jgi:NTP pyrophosphatase (non-canonical NTP hydrolase)